VSKRSYERRLRAKRERERAARRRARRLRRLRIALSAVAAVGVGLGLFLTLRGGSRPAASATPSPPPVAGCTGPTPGPPLGKTYPSPPPMTIDTENTIYVATLKTSCGDIKIKMDPKQAPRTVNNFVFLARERFFDGTRFHRVQNIPGSFAIVQGGDPKGDGTGGPGYAYAGETPPPGTKYRRGTVAMANSGNPSSNGSQFFIVVRDWNDLPPNYTVFGEVIDEGDSFGTLDRMIQATGPPLPGGLGIRPEPPIFLIQVQIQEFARG
jgi:peptidyl-prolyl cis-trans isomerase B (cyclophilin B)